MDAVKETAERTTAPAPVVATPEPTPGVALQEVTTAEHVLAMQRTAGNRLVTRFLARDPAPAAPAATLPDAATLTSRIANCVGIWETNRGGDAPNPRESSLDTVAGVKASMATIEQATEPYALDALRRNASLRKLAQPELTKEEIDAAIARVQAVPTLLTAVANAAAAKTTPDDFIKNQQATITPTGLSDDNVRTMFSAVALKDTIDTKHGELGGKDKKTAKQAAEEIPETDRLGLGTGSLTSYIRDPKKWGENRAAWQRLAVQNMPNDVGGRINAVATSSGGTALATPVIRGRVDAQLAAKPQPTEEALVKAVGAANNPNETGYGDNIWATYSRLYAAPATPAK
jgi:hypothetical protein